MLCGTLKFGENCGRKIAMKSEMKQTYLARPAEKMSALAVRSCEILTCNFDDIGRRIARLAVVVILFFITDVADTFE